MEDWIHLDYRQAYVSVIIPCHNEQRFLEACLNSVLRQQYRPIEVIMVDDGSTDGTRSIMQKYEKTAEEGINVICIFQEQKGAPAARNVGCRLSQGEFIQFLDGDDVLSSNKLMDQVQLLNDMPEVDVAYGDGQYLIQLSNGGIEKGRIISIGSTSDILESMLEGKWVPLFSYLSRRSAIWKCGPWDSSMPVNQDYEYFLRMAIQDCSFQFCNGNTGLYRKHDLGRLSEQAAVIRGRTRQRIVSNAENMLRDRKELKDT